MLPHNHPFDEVVKTANGYIAQGYTIYQKFTCVHCGQRLTMEEPNTFSESGTCDQCGKLTNIRETGCNYMAVLET